MSKINLIVGIALTILLSSCSTSLTPFTKSVYDEYNFSDQELKKIQFYLSDDIVLQRELGGSASKIVNGKIRLVNGREVEEIVFPKGTPGVFVLSPKEERLAISFEDLDENYLMFGPNVKMNNRFVLLGKEWRRGRGKITYKEAVWDTTSESAYTSLLVDLKKARKLKYSRTTARGRKVRTRN